MAQGRFLSKSIAEDKRLNELPLEAQLVYLMAIPHLDRDGLIAGDPPVFFARVCPRRLELAGAIPDLLRQLTESGLITSYPSPNGDVLWFHGFAKNQQGIRYDREGPSEFPPPPGYCRNGNGLVPRVNTPESENSGPTPDLLRQQSGEMPLSISTSISSSIRERERDARATPPPSPPTNDPVSENPAPKPRRKVVRVQSPHFKHTDFNEFGYIPPGQGINAVQVYYEREEIALDAARLSPIQEDDLIRHCPDLDRLREVMIAYSRTNYKRGNLQLIFDWYDNGAPTRNARASPNGNGYGPRPSKVQMSMAAIDSVFAKLRAEGVEI